jgi:DHA1 family multidrug resistance protein-like MFS transporter
MLRELNKNLIYLFSINIAYGLSMQLINPLFPLFLQSAGANEIQNAMVISAGNFAATLLILPSGLFVDRAGKRVLLIINSVISTIAIFLMSMTQNWIYVIPSYLLFSITRSLFMPARMAMIAENSTQRNRATLFGLMNLAWPITGIISPIVSGLLIENLSWKIVFIFASLINAVSIFPAFILKDSKQNVTKIKTTHPGEAPSILDRNILPILLKFFVYSLFITTAISGINLIIPLYMSQHFNLSPSRIGLFFTGSSLITLLTQAPSGRLADRFGKRRIILLFILLMPVLYYLWIPITNWIILLVLYSLVFGLWSMTWPATLALLANSVPLRLQGGAFGVRMTGSRLGFTLGPIIASFLYSNYQPTTPFLAASMISIMGIVVALFLKEN